MSTKFRSDCYKYLDRHQFRSDCYKYLDRHPDTPGFLPSAIMAPLQQGYILLTADDMESPYSRVVVPFDLDAVLNDNERTPLLSPKPRSYYREDAFLKAWLDPADSSCSAATDPNKPLNAADIRIPAPVDYMIKFIDDNKPPVWMSGMDKWADSLADDEGKFQEGEGAVEKLLAPNEHYSPSFDTETWTTPKRYSDSLFTPDTSPASSKRIGSSSNTSIEVQPSSSSPTLDLPRQSLYSDERRYAAPASASLASCV